jgi:hypothetical protein
MDATKRYRLEIAEDWRQLRAKGITDEQAAATLCIHTRSYVRGYGGDVCPDEAQRILAEVTGIPLEDCVWPPARAETWLRRPGTEWDAFARRWVDSGPTTGPAISYVPVGA